MTGDLLLVGVSLGGTRVDVRCAGGRVVEIAEGGLVSRSGEQVVRGAGAVLPGLHDHHLHLLAMAGWDRSVDLGPERVARPEDARRVLSTAVATGAPGQWVRAVGYHERTGGPLDRRVLDEIVPDRPARVQHRSGHLWVLNSPACRALGLDGSGHPGVERDGAGRPTGRLFDGDEVVADRLPRGDPPDLGAVSRRLASYGVTGVTDASPTRLRADLEPLARARRSGALVQRVRVMGALGRDDRSGPPDGLEVGPVKVMVPDGGPVDIGALAERIDRAHRDGRAVALHCVSLVGAALALAAWDAGGVRSGDRMEHGSVLTPEMVDRLARMGVTVVTQPGFVWDRGDDYAAEVDPDELPHLYRCRSLERAGVSVGGGTDAPFGPEDPWVAVSAAISRTTRSGRSLGPDERVDPERALRLFLAPPDRPGGAARAVRVGSPADFCLLDDDLPRALVDPGSHHVVATVVGGRAVYEA